MRVLLTGATGQVGRAIAAQLVGRHVVIGLSRKSVRATSPHEHVQATLGVEDAVRRIEKCVRPCEAIIHAAAAITGDLLGPALSLTNCLGTQQVLELALDWGKVPVIFLSSVPVVGCPRTIPITEEQPVAPRSVYHASKVFGEHLMEIAAQSGWRTASLRLTSPAGPGTPETRILGTFVRCALTGEPLRIAGRGTRRQNYVDVRDVAGAVEACLKAGAAGVYNIAAERATSNMDLAKTCVRVLHSSSLIELTGSTDPEDDVSWEVDISRARREFGYQPSFSVEDSIQALAREYHHPQ